VLDLAESLRDPDGTGEPSEPGTAAIRELESENRALRKQLIEKEEVIDVLKNPSASCQTTLHVTRQCAIMMEK